MSNNTLISVKNFNTDNIIYSKPEVNNIPGQKLSFQRIRLNYEQEDNISDLIIESPPNLLCWGLTEQHDMVSGQLSGYQLPICLWSKNGPTEEEKEFTDTIEKICAHTKKYLVDNRESFGKYDLEMTDLKKFNCLYWKMDKGKIVENRGPTLYAKCMYSKQNERFGTVFVNENLNSNVNPLSILNKQCNVKFALKIESIYIGTKISLQVKLCEVLFRPKETILRSLLAPTAVIKDLSKDESLIETDSKDLLQEEVDEEEVGEVEEEVDEEEVEEEEVDEEEVEEEEEEEEVEEVLEEVKPVPVVKKVETVKPIRKPRVKKGSV